MSSKKRSILLIGIILVLILVVGIIYLLIIRKPKENNDIVEDRPEVVENTIVRSSMGIYQDLNGRVDYQDGNYKLVIENDEENIYVKYNDSQIIETELRGAAKVRVNRYNDLYLLEVKYTMAQCSSMKLFAIDDNGKFIEEINPSEDDISSVEYYSDVNKIVVYKKQCMMDCSNCGKKYTYEVVNNKFKLLETTDLKDEIDYVTKVEEKKDYAYYGFSFNEALYMNDSVYEFTLDEYKIKYVLTDTYNDIKSYDFYVNDKKIYSDELYDDMIIIKKIGKYLIFTNTFVTGVRSTYIYVYDGVDLKTIYELDEIDGMVPINSYITINETGIKVRGTRLDNGPSIVYDNRSFDLYSKETCQDTLKELNDIAIEQDYSYKYASGILSFIPSKSNKYTLKDYTKNDELCNNTSK